MLSNGYWPHVRAACVSCLNGAVIEQGKIYVAPPDHHLIVDVGRNAGP